MKKLMRKLFGEKIDANEEICLATNLLGAILLVAVGWGLKYEWPADVLLIAGGTGVVLLYCAMISSWCSGTGQVTRPIQLGQSGDELTLMRRQKMETCILLLIGGTFEFAVMVAWVVTPIFDHPAALFVGYVIAGGVQALAACVAYIAGYDYPREIM